MLLDMPGTSVKVTTEPTCTTEGVKTFTCTRCGETRTEHSPETKYALSKTDAKAATCTEAGNIEYWTCERCSKIFSDAEGTIEIALADTVINALDHTWDGRSRHNRTHLHDRGREDLHLHTLR